MGAPLALITMGGPLLHASGDRIVPLANGPFLAGSHLLFLPAHGGSSDLHRRQPRRRSGDRTLLSGGCDRASPSWRRARPVTNPGEQRPQGWPVHFGGRFSMNAAIPSWASAIWLAADITSTAYAYALGWSMSI